MGSNPRLHPLNFPAAPAPRAAIRPARLAAPVTLDLGGTLWALHPGGAGRFVVFELSQPRNLVVYDAHEGRVACTIEGVDKGEVAVGRDKVFVGRWTDGRITRYDLRTGAQEAVGGPPEAEKLHRLATASGSHGPLVSAGLTAQTKFMIRAYDPDTLEEMKLPLERPRQDVIRADEWPVASPFSHRTYTDVTVSADGRVIALNESLVCRVLSTR